MKRELSILCVFYTVFVIYGSLVPWHFNNLPMNDAWLSFQNIRYLNLGIESRADWVANILLFIPVSFLWLARFFLPGQMIKNIISTVFVLMTSIFLCSIIEFAQLFFPPRTVSLNDVLAESLGAVIGIVVWWVFCENFIKYFEILKLKSSHVYIYLQIYLLGLLFYSVLPLDLTLSPVELFHKWREGRIILLPFSGLKGEFFRDIYDSLSDIVLWIPVPWLWLKQEHLGVGQLLRRVFFAALAIEFFQLFVFSRITDVTDVIFAAIGGFLGIGLTGFNANLSLLITTRERLKVRSNWFFYACFAYCLWLGLLVSVFWYPYNFQFSYSLFIALNDRFFRIPFYAYYYGSEFRAITEVFHKVLFFMPLGLISELIVRPMLNRRLALLFALSLNTIGALGIEVGQLFLPDKNSDITDVILEVLGGHFGFVLSRKFFRFDGFNRRYGINEQMHRADMESKPYIVEEQLVHYRKSPSFGYRVIDLDIKKRGILFGVSGGILIFAGLVFISHFESVPYNVRELFSKDYPVIAAFGIVLLLYWCFAYPLFFLIKMSKMKKGKGWFCVKQVVIHSMGAWILVRAVIPMESIYDIIGNPILNISPEVEMFFRFVTLFSVYSLMILGAVHYALLEVISDYQFKRFFVLGVFWLLLLLPISYWIVVVQAATDNLTELMANGGKSFLIINILLYFFLFGWLGAFISVIIVFKKYERAFVVFAIFIISFPLGYELMNWGTEQVIFKYGSVFSAMQFLFSPDRESLVPENILRFRFFVMHFGLIVMVIVTQLPLMMFFYEPIGSWKSEESG